MSLALNKIYNEDGLEGMKKIADKSIDMILCDLPYGTTANKWDTVIPLDRLWKQYERIIKDNGAIVLTASQPFTTDLISSNRKLFKYEWIWIKNNSTGFVHARNMPMKKHENILVFSKASMGHMSLLGDKRMNYNPQGVIYTDETRKIRATRHGRNLGARPNQVGKEYKGAKNFPTSILQFKNDGKLHPTQKPVALFEYLIKTYTNEGETVLDNCIGSGTTAIACLNTNRNFIGFELDEEYWKIANERIEKHII